MAGGRSAGTVSQLARLLDDNRRLAGDLKRLKEEVESLRSDRFHLHLAAPWSELVYDEAETDDGGGCGNRGSGGCRWRPPMPAEFRLEVWSEPVEYVRQPGEGNTSRPFFVKVRAGLTVLKFMQKGTSSGYFFADRILKQLGTRTPAFAFALPEQPVVAAVRDSIGQLISSRVDVVAAKLRRSDWAVIPDAATDRTASLPRLLVFGRLCELRIFQPKAFKSKQQLEAFLAEALSETVGHCRCTVRVCDNDEGGGGSRGGSDGGRGGGSGGDEGECLEVLCTRTDPSDFESAHAALAALDSGMIEGKPWESLLILEYVKGSRMDEALNAHDCAPGGDSAVAALFEKIGEVLVGDLIINNHDRFRLPGVWDSEGNAGNILVTSQLKVVSIDHEIDARPEANFGVINSKFSSFLSKAAAAEEVWELPQLDELVRALCRDATLFEGLEPFVLRGLVKGLLLVANWPRLWNPKQSPGLFEYLNAWRNDWRRLCPTLPLPGDEAWVALRNRVEAIHYAIYPRLLLNRAHDPHAMLAELFKRNIPHATSRRRPSMPLLALRPLPVRSSVSGALRSDTPDSRYSSNRTSAMVGPAPLQHALGPFTLRPLALRLVSADLPAADAAVSAYAINLSEWHGSTAVSGRLSPRSRVTLPPHIRAAARIPDEAAFFAFAYAVATDADCRELGDLNLASAGVGGSSRGDAADAVSTFVSLGGFVYWNADGSLCAACALHDGPGIHFELPKRLPTSPDVRAALYARDRVMPPAIEHLVRYGVSGFCWVAPDERFGEGDHEETNSPLSAYGAFVCLYDEQYRQYDTYYKIAPVNASLAPNGSPL